jgi:hypothetical protein
MEEFVCIPDIPGIKNVTENYCAIFGQAASLYLISALFVFAIVIAIILSFTQRRVYLAEKCCWSRPSLVIPLNMMTSTPHRFIYTIIFGSATDTLVFIIINQNQLASTILLSVGIEEDPYFFKLLSLLITLFIVIGQSILYYPLFACIDAPSKLLGHIMGVVYSTLWLLLYIFMTLSNIFGCSNAGCTNSSVIAVGILSEGPTLFFNGTMTIWYIVAVVYHFLPIKNKTILKHKSDYHHKAVKYLLQRRTTSLPDGRLRSKMKPIIDKLKPIADKIYIYNPSFKFPLRFLVAMIISFVALYQFFIQFMQISIDLIRLASAFRNVISKFLVTFVETSKAYNLSENVTSIIEDSIPEISNSILGPPIILFFAILISTLFCFILLMSLFRSVSRHLQELKVGKRPIEVDNKIHSQLLSSLRYPAYQVAYTLFAWLMYVLALSLVGAAIQIGYYGLRYYTYAVFTYTFGLIVLFVWSQAIYLLQWLLCRFTFIKKRSNNTKEVSNRRLLHWFTYVLLFQNALIGFFSSLLRIFYSVIFGFLFLLKFDRPLLMKGFESFDRAHNTYLGFLWLEYSQNNSIVNVFCDELWRSVKKTTPVTVDAYSDGDSGNSGDSGDSGDDYSPQVNYFNGRQCMYIQWYLSNVDTFGAFQSVLISKVIYLCLWDQ